MDPVSVLLPNCLTCSSWKALSVYTDEGVFHMAYRCGYSVGVHSGGLQSKCSTGNLTPIYPTLEGLVITVLQVYTGMMILELTIPHRSTIMLEKAT